MLDLIWYDDFSSWSAAVLVCDVTTLPVCLLPASAAPSAWSKGPLCWLLYFSCCSLTQLEKPTSLDPRSVRTSELCHVKPRYRVLTPAQRPRNHLCCCCGLSMLRVKYWGSTCPVSGNHGWTKHCALKSCICSSLVSPALLSKQNREKANCV